MEDPSLTFLLAAQKSSPELVLLNTADMSRLLYSQLQYP